MAQQPSFGSRPRQSRRNKAPLHSRTSSSHTWSATRGAKGRRSFSRSARTHPSGTRTAHGRSRDHLTPSYQSLDQLTTPAKLGFDRNGLHIPTGNSELLLSRRQLLYGVAAVGAVAAVGGVATLISNAQAANDGINTLQVDTDSVFGLESLTELAPEEALSLVASGELPYGSLVWASSDDVAACLIPTDDVSPLCQVALLKLGSASSAVVLEEALGAEDGFEIYDVRASEAGLLWTEANIMRGRWMVWGAPYNGSTIGSPLCLEEGDANWEMPSLACVGKYGYWQLRPQEEGEAAEEPSVLKRARFARLRENEILYQSEGMATPVYPARDGVVITPRHYEASSSYQLVFIDGESGETADALTLPSRMRPLEAGYGYYGFMFSFSNIYDYGGGISNLGTYTPAEPPEAYDYDGLSWFHFSRVPSMAPCWLEDRFVVKSTTAVCVIDLNQRSYTTIPLENNTEDYGDYLASFGVRHSIVTCMNIDESKRSGTAATGDEERYCTVRIWRTLNPNASTTDKSSDG